MFTGYRKINKKLWIPISAGAAFLLFLFVHFIFHERAPGDIGDQRFLLNTVVTVKLFQTDRQDLLEESFTLIESYEKQLSRHINSSEISRINTAPAGTAVSVSAETSDLIKKALYYAELSGGRFDPTVAPLVDLWGIGTEAARIPDIEEIAGVLPLIDYRSVNIDEKSGTVTLEKKGMALDLGGITKGWIADRIGEFLIENGVQHFLINLGGNVLVHGGKAVGRSRRDSDYRPFHIGMQSPFDKRGQYLGIFSLKEGSVVSSGIYERFFESGSIRYHHILSTEDGFPVENNLAAVTVISDKSLDGDALSTTLFALGLDEGMKLIQSIEGFEAAFVTREGKVVLSSGAADIYSN